MNSLEMPEAGRFLLSLMRVGVHVHHALEATLKPFGITPLELDVMRHLGVEQWTSVSALARFLGMTTAGVRKPLMRLWNDDLIAISRVRRDRRCHEARLVPATFPLLVQAFDAIEALEAQFCDKSESELRLDRWLEERALQLRPHLRPPSLAALMSPVWSGGPASGRTMELEDNREPGTRI